MVDNNDFCLNSAMVGSDSLVIVHSHDLNPISCLTADKIMQQNSVAKYNEQFCKKDDANHF